MSEQYLPIGSRIAVRDSKGESQWYTTKRDVTVKDAQPAQCPMRSGLPVLTISYSGWGIYFLPGQVRAKLSKEEMKRATSAKFFQLKYDVPSGQGIASPCPRLYPIAIRDNLSCWIIAEEYIPWQYLNELSEQGVDWRLNKLDPSEGPALVQQAIDALDREVRESLERAEQSRVDAERILTAETPNVTPEKRRKTYLSRIDAIQKRVNELLVNLEKSATTFGIDLRRIRKDVATQQVAAIANTMRERARTFVAAVNAVETHGTTDGRVLVNGVRNGSTPWQVLSDYAQDQGIAEGEQLAAVMSEPTTDNHLTSLIDDDDAE